MLCLICFFDPVCAQTKGGRLEGKVVIIAGASKGIGKSTAEVFASEGARVVLVSRTPELLAKLTEEIRNKGNEADFIVADVTREEDMQRMAQEVMKKYKRIDVLLYNAGIYPVSRVDIMTSKEWHQVLDTNLTGGFYAVKACLPFMKQQKHGRILFTSSISGPRVGLPGVAHYTASKAGLDGFMKTIAIELAKYNITVNAVEPGTILIDTVQNLGAEHIKNMTRAVPLGRLGAPEEVAYAHPFLASDEAAYITGQSIIVDGGQVLPESHHLEY
ncbi:MAG: SDR family oxidoreductase [Alphaproteobacteria bacterium]|nr:SDR family oxidoreductase [Alphaproteobacteria bacterium]